MTTPEPKLLAAGAAVFLAIVGGLLLGRYPEGAQAPGRRVELGWEGLTEPAQKRCIETVGLASDEALELFRLERDAGLSSYVYTVLMVDAEDVADAGTAAELPSGMLAMQGSQAEIGCPEDAGYRFLAVLQGEPEWPCACSSGVDCDLRLSVPGQGTAWVPAPRGLTMAPGQWAHAGLDGGGCIPKTCVELAGQSSMPEACL